MIEDLRKIRKRTCKKYSKSALEIQEISVQNTSIFHSVSAWQKRNSPHQHPQMMPRNNMNKDCRWLGRAQFLFPKENFYAWSMGI
jgi:hypothetical protein